ncbi:MAG: imidazoleglycerol-phosphate dehydratase, partial [Clostridia bacterium]|nr:imidazoleglycerol-phosphate dehydratase [Clostridia bacterium]
MRRAEINRDTAETSISLSFEIDGTGEASIDSGIGFLDHMLTLFARHGRFDIDLKCNGDVNVDDHHSVEDIGICLGKAFKKALGEKKGICRYGDAIIPMDEALIMTAVDISGRSFL